MRRSLLLKRIRREAQARGFEFVMVRQGSRHELWRCGHVLVPIPRHRDIDDTTAEAGIFCRLEPMFGPGWWR